MAIIGFRHYGRAFPTRKENGETLVPGIGFPFQLSPTEMGIFVNLRLAGVIGWDIEVGSDLHILSDLRSPGEPIAISRGGRIHDSKHGESLIEVHSPVHGGFIPLGAQRQDGSPHPHAGTGFGLHLVIPSPGDGTNATPEFCKSHPWRWVLLQFSYDGAGFHIDDQRTLSFTELLEGHYLWNNALGSAIPDGDDLLLPMIGNKGQLWSESGLTRWRRIGNKWQIISYASITGEDSSEEPSIIRDIDGSLLLTSRGSTNSTKAKRDHGEPAYNELSVWLWRSIDGGKTWEMVMDRRIGRARAPVSLNAAADGTPFFMLNPYRPDLPTAQSKGSRARLVLESISDDRKGTCQAMTFLDSLDAFGPAPYGANWICDHPVGAVIRLADGQLHTFATYRILDHEESHGNKPPTAYSGCHISEIMTDGLLKPTWRF